MSDSMWKKEISFGRKPKADAPDASVEADVAAAPAAPDAPKQSLLKKEISFGRKPKEPKAPKEKKEKAPKPESTSLLKKEISFGRKPKVAAEPVVAETPEAAAEAAAEPAAKQSFLKKEISFGRKPKVAAEPVVAQAAEPAAEPAAKKSFLKKEISFGRKKHDQEVERLVHEAAQSLSPSFAPAETATAETLPTALAEAAVAAMAEAQVHAEAQAQADFEAQAHAQAQAEADARAQAQAEADAQAEAQAQAAVEAEAHAQAQADAEAEALARAHAEAVALAQAAAEASAEVEPAPAAFDVPGPVTSTFVEHVPAELEHVEPEPVALEPIEREPVAPVQPIALAAVPTPEPVDLHAVAPLPAEAVLSEPVPVEAAASELEPVAAAEDVVDVPAPPAVAAPVALEPLPEPVAFEPVAAAPVAAEPVSAYIEPVAVEPEPEAWVEAPAAEPAESWLAEPELPPIAEPVAAVVIHPPVTAAELPPLPDGAAKGPFWKKELSFSRKPKEPKAAKEPKTPKTPKAGRAPKEQGAAVPFWKKQVSFSRKPKSAPTEIAAADAPTVALPAGPTLPFWKKLSFSMPALSLPKRSSGGGKGGGKSGGHSVKKLVGLKIGSSQLAAARVSNNGVAEVQQLAREALAPGIVVGGELRDPEALGDALKGFFARNKLPKKGVRLGIASNRIGVRIFDIVGVTEGKQLANAIHFRAQETLPIPLDEAVLDYRVLDESVDAEGQPVTRVLLVVVYRELVERYVSACKKAGITLAGIDLEAFALLRSLAPPVDRGSSALVGVAIGFDRSTFAVSDGRVCEFTRVLEWGGSAINVALARTFDSTPSEVEAIKRSISLDESIVPPGLTEEQTAQAVDAVRRQVQSFARELVSSLQFYQNQPGSLGIGEIVLTGGTTHLPGLAAELERLIGVHVRVGDPFARVKVSKRLSDTEQSGSLAVAIGLGIED